MNASPTLDQLLRQAEQSVQRVIDELTLRGEELKRSEQYPRGAELVDQTLAAAQNARVAIEAAIGGSVEKPTSRNESNDQQH